MYSKCDQARRQVMPRVVMVAAVLALAVGCGKQEAPEAEAVGGQPAGTAIDKTDVAQTPSPSGVGGLSVDQLREGAATAYRESRLYAPAGDNAMEYYLALRDKQPGDAGVSSALIDLLPMVVIATEQSRDREDFEEARRLLALIEHADASHPALERLKTTIDEGESAAVRRAEQQRLSAEQEALRRQQLERERIELQRIAQEQAALELAQQQAAVEAARQEAARQEAARQEAARQEAARQEAARQEAARQEAARQEAARQEAARQEAAREAAEKRAATPQLRAISTPAPRYPPEALRAGTSGQVQVELTIGVDGSVTNARVVRADPPRVFDREALAAVRRWRFEPVTTPVTTRRVIAFAPDQ